MIALDSVPGIDELESVEDAAVPCPPFYKLSEHGVDPEFSASCFVLQAKALASAARHGKG